MSSVSEGTLHCLASAPASEPAQRLLAQLERGEPILLLGKAVVLAGIRHPDIECWLEHGISLYALSEDVAAYGVTKTHESVTTVSYADWVKLTERYGSQILWR